MTIAGHHNPGAAAERPARTKRAKLRGVGAEPLELSERHLEVLRLMADGLKDAQIAAALGIAVLTVGGHVTTIYSRLGARNRAHAVALGFRRRLLVVPPAQAPALVQETDAERMAAAGWQRRSNGEWVPARIHKTTD